MIFFQDIYGRRGFLSLLILIVLLIPYESIAVTNYKDKIVEASKLIKSGKINEALIIYGEIAEGDYGPDLKARALFFTASVYDSYLNQPETALQFYDRIIKLYPESKIVSDSIFNRAILMYKTGHIKESIDFFSLYLSKYRGTIRFQSAEKWLNKLKSEYAKKFGKIVVSQDLRVLVGNFEKIALIDADKEIIVSDSISGKILFVGNGPFAVGLKGDSFEINSEKIDSKYIIFESQDGIVYSSEKKYRGKLGLYRDNGVINIINIIPVEEYLYGVLPKEMPSEWSSEALMAQAVASRTYALYMKEKNRDNLYDVESDTNYQVYGGFDAESLKSNQAVDDTAGMVISLSGSLIPSYFHSDSGGYTESSENVWEVKHPALQSKKDIFSLERSNNNWELSVSYKELSELFGLGDKEKIIFKTIRKTRSGRIRQVALISGDQSVVVTGYELRKRIGFTRLKSTLFNVYTYKDGFLFKGRGYGHGVGMSQWGALKMAKMGYSFKDILKFYYKGIDFVLVSNSEFK